MLPSSPDSARPDERNAAFRLLLAHLPEEDREQRLANFLWLVEAGEIDGRGILVVRGRKGLDGVLVCVAMPGATALIFPPVCRAGPLRQAQEDGLIRHACSFLRKQGVRVVQGLLGADEVDRGEALERNGIRHITSLCSLRHDLDLPTAWLSLPVRLDYATYRTEDPDLFAHTLGRTYEGTLDCPELTGARTMGQVLEGHQKQGAFDPGLWWLARLGDEPVGVLLVVPSVDLPEWEIAYLGLVPEVRGRGLGKELLLKGLCEARAAEVSGVNLSVDERNRPACRLYFQAGFVPYDQRAVYLAVWR